MTRQPKQAKEKRLTQTDKLANVPAFALAYHIADHDSPDFAPTVLLNLILQGDDSSRLFQRLVKEKEISLDWAGGINFELGNEFDYDGPMLMVSRTTYKPGHTGEEILKEVDAVVRELQEHGVTKKELDAAKVRFRSNFYSQLESTFGKANLLASFALFNDDPQRINKVVALYDAVTPEQIKSAAQRYLTPENRTSIDRVPEKKEAK
jgi:zinc protease